ncbi:hypothetical protein [Bacillus testis]|uniref:hypothetical protein n=1 Tax=Bacillus testis TaxID=1622072 RepID=UPI00067EB645|nr:hypothetical protein [Bacillus testis]
MFPPVHSSPSKMDPVTNDKYEALLGGEIISASHSLNQSESPFNFAYVYISPLPLSFASKSFSQ